ncbi:hypothetical protein BDB01DRAFT_858169 [Pilobolus umbonatus]|nr:hypothetical protein BDB01DRAFT_858169 [Pilobolus umbonatus]
MHSHKIDPYRAIRKSSPDVHPSRYESDQADSRSPSESSTTQLAMSPAKQHMTAPNNIDMYPEQYEDYSQDPYHSRQNKTSDYRKKKGGDQRANSYLPYSNHKPAPYEPNNPILLQDDEDYLPSFDQPGKRGPVGSILQDNINMDMLDHNGPYQSPPENAKVEAVEPPAKKRAWWLRLGISGKKMVFITFGLITVIAIVWFIVWPRVPTLEFVNAELAEYETVITEDSMDVAWSVNFTVKNEDNFIPTSIKNFEFTIYNANTQVAFGKGNSGKLTLKPKSIGQIITIPIYVRYTSTGPNDQTWRDLYDSCIRHTIDVQAPVNQQSLNIRFQVVYYIAGLTWTYVSNFTPASGYFQCPNPP